MREPKTVAACVAAMREAVSIPVTVKCRIAIDEDPERETLFDFVDRVADAGCDVFTVHARKAWLKGLSPKENREIPPLNYDLVAALKAERPKLQIILNGGIKTLDECRAHLALFDGVMLGRAAYQMPALLGQVDRTLFDPSAPVIRPEDAVRLFRPYIEARLAEGIRLSSMTRHILGLFNGLPGARRWRRTLSELGPKPGADISVLDEALSAVEMRAPAC
jgi:tRNA-dihydrouridine synthase A